MFKQGRNVILALRWSYLSWKAGGGQKKRETNGSGRRGDEDHRGPWSSEGLFRFFSPPPHKNVSGLLVLNCVHLCRSLQTKRKLAVTLFCPCASCGKQRKEHGVQKLLSPLALSASVDQTKCRLVIVVWLLSCRLVCIGLVRPQLTTAFPRFSARMQSRLSLLFFINTTPELL